MSRRLTWVMFVVAVASGLLAFNGIYRRLNAPAPASAVTPTPKIPVVVARLPLKRGTVLGAEHLQVVQRARAEMPSDVAAEPSALLGRMVKTPVEEGVPIVESALVSLEPRTAASEGAAVPVGYRSVGVFVDTRGGIQQFLRTGDRVDVVVTVEQDNVGSSINSNQPTRKVVSSKVLLQDVQVLDVPGEKQESQQNQTPTAGLSSFRADTSKERMPVVLALTPSDAEKLSMAMQVGTIHLIKRGVSDDTVASTAGVNLNTLFAGDAKQILIEVRFAEVDRTKIRDLGVDFQLQDEVGTASQFLTGGLVPQTFDTTNLNRLNTSSVKDVSLSSTVTHLLEWHKGPDINAAINALEEKGLLRILAEPNLVAVSGEEASFLAGGEFPIPVVQSTTGSTTTSNSVTIEFKKFGIQLNFRPDVVNEQEIRMLVQPEVSILDFGQAAVKIAGFSIPGLITRRASTTVQMRSGESLVIGGLLSQLDDKTTKQVPYLGNIPILGKLFTSEKFKNQESELIVVVTPRLTQPMQLNVKQRFSDPRTIEEAVKVQLAEPPYEDARADAIRKAILHADELKQKADVLINSSPVLQSATQRPSSGPREMVAPVEVTPISSRPVTPPNGRRSARPEESYEVRSGSVEDMLQ